MKEGNELEFLSTPNDSIEEILDIKTELSPKEMANEMVLDSTDVEVIDDPNSEYNKKLAEQMAQIEEMGYDPRTLKRRKQIPFERKEAKVGRNEPCTCGSGKKYKKCCMGKTDA